MEQKTKKQKRSLLGKCFAFNSAILMSLSGWAVPNTEQLDFSKGESRVEFLAIGRPSALKIHGKGGPLKGKLGLQNNQIAGVIDVDLNTFDTGIGLRNSHMKEKYLHTTQYPNAQLTIQKVQLPEGWRQMEKKFEDIGFEGLLKLHGIEKPVTGKMNFTQTGKVIDGSAQFRLKISDFQIDVPSYAGIKVADEVAVQTFFKSPIEVQN